MENNIEGPLGAMILRWWTFVLRGVAAILFGILAIAMPQTGLVALVILWGGYALTDGILGLVLAAHRGRSGQRWGWLLFEGLVSIAAGVLTFAWPGITAMFLLALIAIWAVITGTAEIAAAVRLRRHVHNEWLLAASGVLSIAFGVLLLVYPRSGALAIVWLIGIYALLFGALLISVGVRLKGLRRAGERRIPAGGVPATA